MSDLVLAGLDAFPAEEQHEIGQTLSCLLSGFGRSVGGYGSPRQGGSTHDQ
jgi:hypothetical protein